MPFATTWMNLELAILSEVSQAEEDKYMISLIYGILKNHTNELVYKTQTDPQTSKSNLWLPKGKGGGEG